MKNRSAAFDTILSSRQYVIYELWDIQLVTGQLVHFTTGDIPLNGVTVYVPGGTVGPYNYQTGMTIVRETYHQKAGTEAGQLKAAFVPQGDSPFAPIDFNGYDIRQAARYGFMDGATVRVSKFVCLPAAATGGQIQVSQGAMAYFMGTVQVAEPNRMFVDLTVEDYLAAIAAQQMPRNLISVGCFHQVYDAGCTLLKSSFTVTGTIGTVTDSAHFNTNLTQADHYFELGQITMTSGPANGQTGHISSYLNASGAMIIVPPFSVAPVAGNTFTAFPGCDRQYSTCSGKFSNTAHFSGEPFVPDPSTVIDGGTDNPPMQTPGAQAGYISGSQPSGKKYYGTYQP